VTAELRASLDTTPPGQQEYNYNGIVSFERPGRT